MDTTEADALAENTLVLQKLTTLLASIPDAASLLLTAISDDAKKPQSSSNRGRKDGISDSKYRVGKVKRVKMEADLGAINTANDAPSLQDVAAQRGTWKTMELLAGLLAANLIPK